MKQVYVVSKCIGVEDKGYYHFKFNGIYQGNIISEIIAEVTHEELEIDEEYLLLLENIQCEHSKLYGKALHVKKLFATFPH